MENFLERPELIDTLDRAEFSTLFVKVKSLEGALLARLLSGVGEASQLDRVLNIDELIAATGMSRRTLFAKSKSLPFITRTGRKSIVGSERALNRWLAANRRK